MASETDLTLFDALVDNDLEGMVNLYALNCRTALHSVSRLNDIRYISSTNPDGNQEGTQANKKTITSSNHDDNLATALKDLDTMILSSQRTDIGIASPIDQVQLQAPDASSSHLSFHHRRGSSTSPFVSTLFDDPARLIPSNLNLSTRSRLRHMQSRADQIFDPATDIEIEWCLNERVRALTNARPQSTFIVHCKKGKMRENDDDDDDDDDGEMPIFDGAVANATPPGLNGSGGGSGTILHLACALDSPFALILFLLMGGDASCRHTAFRRLILHEAACTDSPKCLKLLLDMGESFQNDTKDHMEIDFFARQKRNDRKIPSQTNVSKRCENGMKNRGFRPPQKNTSNPALRVVTLLRTALDLAKKIMNGEMEDTYAAEILLNQFHISESNKRFIVLSCGSDHATDGHGNTPLHWAAFKNSLKCSQILLSYHTDPNAVAENSGWTPLHDAAYSDSTETISLLISYGADVNVRANSGATPLCFAAQEDAPNATQILLRAGADATVRCCEEIDSNGVNNQNANRFSGYTPLHYCAHYNAYRAVQIILEHHNRSLFPNNEALLEIPDLNDKLPIHVAAARGSSDVLRELLHYGARVETGRSRTCSMSIQNDEQSTISDIQMDGIQEVAFTRSDTTDTSMSDVDDVGTISPIPCSALITPVSSPILRSMIPLEPIDSPKPWNCISQMSIDECKTLIQEAESSWAPERHSIFHPCDRRAVLELLRVGKHLEQIGTGIFVDLWPLVLSFCGRGWFEPEKDHNSAIYLPQISKSCISHKLKISK